MPILSVLGSRNNRYWIMADRISAENQTTITGFLLLFSAIRASLEAFYVLVYESTKVHPVEDLSTPF